MAALSYYFLILTIQRCACKTLKVQLTIIGNHILHQLRAVLNIHITVQNNFYFQLDGFNCTQPRSHIHYIMPVPSKYHCIIIKLTLYPRCEPMSSLSYLSSLEEVVQSSDSDLRDGIGFLAPQTVIGRLLYSFYPTWF